MNKLAALYKFCEDLGFKLDMTAHSHQKAVDNFVEATKKSIEKEKWIVAPVKIDERIQRSIFEIAGVYDCSHYGLRFKKMFPKGSNVKITVEVD